MKQIIVEHLVKTFQEGDSQICALNDISFNVEQKEFVVFMGPSGAGKSTLINILAGLDVPSHGSVYINNKLISSMSDSAKCDLRRYEIGIVFQFFNLHPKLSVAENIELPLVIAEIPKKERPDKIDRVIELLNLTKRSNHFPYELSGGEKQRTAIARALVMNPSILLADEPTGDLDSESGTQIVDILHELNMKEMVTIIEVTHDEAMLRPKDRLIQMEDGKIINDQVFTSKDQITY
ncbi:MAG: ABC transporter ATP-binding protein [Candidatus Hodarchaeota archaeon]